MGQQKTLTDNFSLEYMREQTWMVMGNAKHGQGNNKMTQYKESLMKDNYQ